MEHVDELFSLCQEAGLICEKGASMKPYTSFRIGGPAALLIKVKNAGEISWIRKNLTGRAPVHFIGKGSDLLVSDDGVDGIVVLLGSRFSGVTLLEDRQTLLCEAGAPLAKVCYAAYQNGLTGLEFAWGIPGTIGGGAYMNAGAYGGEMKDVVHWCEHVDQNGAICRLLREELDYRYRHSVYTGKNHCIVRVAVRLQKGEPTLIRARMDELFARRKEKQPLEYPSGGSTFKRPEGAYAAALIEQCGLKGTRIGGAMVSEKHSGFLINVGDATCFEMRTLIKLVQDTVFEKTGYRLECEIEGLA